MALERNRFIYHEPIEDGEARGAMGFYVSADAIHQLGTAFDTAVTLGEEAILYAEVEVVTAYGKHGGIRRVGTEIRGGIIGDTVVMNERIPLGIKDIK